MPLTKLMIDQLKLNKTCLACMDPHFRDRMNEIGVQNFQFMHDSGTWFDKCGDTFCFGSTYRLKGSYVLPKEAPSRPKLADLAELIEAALEIYPAMAEFLVDDWKERLLK